MGIYVLDVEQMLETLFSEIVLTNRYLHGEDMSTHLSLTYAVSGERKEVIFGKIWS